MSEPSAGPQAEPEFKPFIPADKIVPEFTFLPIAVGAILGIIFAWSSAYLGLKVGQTVSASIPVAVLSITIFRWASKTLRIRQATILENNMAQTVGSAGESLAAGIVFTMPALLLMGHEMETGRVLLVALLGGLIGVLMMIPMRHGLIVKEHGKLTYPEGTACADLLIVGETGGTSAKTVFIGFFVGASYAFCNLIAKLWLDVASFAFSFGGKLKGASLSFEVSPPMLGVGYIIGPRIAAQMMAGGMLGFLILVPLMHLFGDATTVPMAPELVKTIADMDPNEMRAAYIRYIGAGAVATGGFVSLARGLPTIVGAFRSGLKSMRPAPGGAATAAVQEPRTRQDLPMNVVLGGSLALALAIWLAPTLEINLLSAGLIVLFGFFFTTVSSRVTGEIGSSSNPISGMTIATLLITCGLFVVVGWTGTTYKAMALTTAALVCVAASNGGTISQDLKTGFLVGATPKLQQLGIGIGVLTSAVVIGFVVASLNLGNTTWRPVDLEYPVQAAGEHVTGPNGQPYQVVYVAEDIGEVPRGKYLADPGGRLKFLVDPGIAGGFPYRIEKASYAGVKLEVPADAQKELGLDHQSYAVVELKERRGEVAPGRYLVTDTGEIAFAKTEVKKFPAPQAQLFRLIIDGTLGGKLPWGLVIIGVLIALVLELVGVPALPVAVGLYLPLSTSAGVFAGGLVRALVDRRRKGESAAESEFSPGMLMASGLIAGGAITGVIQSGLLMFEKDKSLDFSETLGSLATNDSWWPMGWFVLMAASLWYVGTRKK